MKKSIFRGSIFGAILPILYSFSPPQSMIPYFGKFPYKKVMPTALRHSASGASAPGGAFMPKGHPVTITGRPLFASLHAQAKNSLHAVGVDFHEVAERETVGFLPTVRYHVGDILFVAAEFGECRGHA